MGKNDDFRLTFVYLSDVSGFPYVPQAGTAVKAYRNANRPFKNGKE